MTLWNYDPATGLVVSNLDAGPGPAIDIWDMREGHKLPPEVGLANSSPMDLDRVEFGGLVLAVAEDELGASFSGDQDGKLMERLYRECQQARPKNQMGWIRTRLRSVFVCIGKRPRWVQDLPEWPFHEGKPMVFIGQMKVPSNSTARQVAAPGEVLYIFGARHPVEGWLGDALCGCRPKSSLQGPRLGSNIARSALGPQGAPFLLTNCSGSRPG